MIFLLVLIENKEYLVFEIHDRAFVRIDVLYILVMILNHDHLLDRLAKYRNKVERPILRSLAIRATGTPSLCF